MYRAIGICYQGDGCSNSHEIDADQAQIVADAMQRRDKVQYDQIVLLENGNAAPRVVAFWLCGVDYDADAG